MDYSTLNIVTNGPYDPNPDWFMSITLDEDADPDWIEVLWETLDKHPDATLVFSPIYRGEDVYGAPSDVTMIMWYARRNMTGDIPYILGEVDTELASVA